MDNLKCCHFVVTGQFRNAKLQHFQGFLAFWGLLPLNRRWGFTGDIVDDAVNMGDLIDDAGGGAVEDVVGDTSPIGGHEVGGGDAAEGEGIVVGAADRKSVV